MDKIKTMTGLLEGSSINIKKPVYTYNGIPVPRVTEILSKTISEDYLMNWANSLGFKRQSYKKTLEAAASIGTSVHDQIHKYIIGELPIVHDYDVSLQAFIKWFDIIKNNHSYKILGTEVCISCPYFGGTYDLLIEIDGLVYMVDFKTSNHISYKHFIQESAYSFILKTQYGINIDGYIILQLDKYSPSYEEYIVSTVNKDHKLFMDRCLNTFLSLVYSYYNINSTQEMYNKIF